MVRMPALARAAWAAEPGTVGAELLALVEKLEAWPNLGKLAPLRLGAVVLKAERGDVQLGGMPPPPAAARSTLAQIWLLELERDLTLRIDVQP